MEFVTFHNAERPTVMLIPGLGVSYEIFMPLVELLKSHYNIVAAIFTIGMGRRRLSWLVSKQDICCVYVPKPMWRYSAE